MQSTPTHSPIQRVFWPQDQWGPIEGGGRSEVIRTKRKFLPLKPAKRLPHHSSHRLEGESTWEVHAAVIDVGLDAGELDDLEGVEEVQPAGRKGKEVQSVTPRLGTKERADRRKGRIVRFEDSRPEDSSNEAGGSSSPDWPLGPAAQGATLSPSLSLSQFQFPAPPGSNWDGTFGEDQMSSSSLLNSDIDLGHLTEPNSPASPATLHYRYALVVSTGQKHLLTILSVIEAYHLT